MRNYLFLITLLIALASVSKVSAEDNTPGVDLNTSKVHSLPYGVNVLKPYSEGLIYTARVGATDIIGASADGATFNTIETLRAGTVDKLESWAGDKNAYYYGDAANGMGTELRIFNGASAKMLLNYGHGTNPAVGNVQRMEYDDNQIVYYYTALGRYDMFKGYEAWVYQTDGTDPGTLRAKLNTGETYINPYHTAESQEGFFKGFIEGSDFYFISGINNGGMYNMSAVFKMNHSVTGGSEADYVFSLDDMSSSISEVTPFDDYYLFATRANIPQNLSYVIKDDLDNPRSVENFRFHNTETISLGENLFGIGCKQTTPSPAETHKLVQVVNKEARLISINNENISDNIKYLTLSDNYLFFAATHLSDGNCVYVIDATLTNPEPYLISQLGDVEVTALEALPGGNVAIATWSEADQNSMVFVNEAFSSSSYNLSIENSDGIMNMWPKVDHILYNNGLLYVTAQVGNGQGCDIYTHKLDDFGFETSSTTITILNKENEPVVGAKLTLANGNFTTTLTSNDKGECAFNEAKLGTYSYTIEADGYTTKNANQYFGAGADLELSINLNTDADVVDRLAYKVTDETTAEVLVGAEIVITYGPYTYTETADENGEALFSNVRYGDYEVNISADNYANFNGNISVDEDYSEERSASLLPLSTLTFGIEAFYPSEEYPYQAGVHITLVSQSNPDLVFYKTTVGDMDMPNTIFKDVPYGTYTCDYEFAGYITQSFEIEVVKPTHDFEGKLEEARADLNFEIYEKDGTDTPIQGVWVKVYDVGAVHPFDMRMSDENGKCTFQNASFKEIVYVVEHSGLTTETGSFVWNEDFEDDAIVVNLFPPANFTTLIQSKDADGNIEVIGGAYLALTNTEDVSISFDGETGEDGTFLFQNIPYGTYDYLVRADGYISETGIFEVDAETVSSVEATLDPAIVSFNVLVQDDDAPVNRATVIFTSKTNSSLTFEAVTLGEGSEAGVAKFINVDFGEYYLSVEAKGYATYQGEFSINEETIGGPTILLEGNIANLPVQVFNTELVGLGNAEVILKNNEFEDIVYSNYTSNEAATLGSLIFEDVIYGTYTFEISLNGYVTIIGEYVHIENGAGIGEVFLEDLVDVRITVLGDRNNRVPNALVTLTNLDDSSIVFEGETEDSDDYYGLVSFLHVPFGNYTYSVSALDFSPKEGSYNFEFGSEMEFEITLERRVGIDDVENEISVYPNPAQDVLNIQTNIPIKNLSFYAISGQKVKELSDPNSTVVNIADLAPGLYILKVVDTNNSETIKKINKL
ncbi:carboxypeptidase regulatory-like domain-containing protein [Saccharicrinis aurantiacus]|uniref:carboxypeptidase regulatory-like domain-containing protein n=1 Tax=Saccharicrinis aurantiacus TaxID=1849719 RepID=UPI002493943E|nr:carboxypeptidase regulatory-like domain-containing protein [Saccharicrinis aurantiacus]